MRAEGYDLHLYCDNYMKPETRDECKAPFDRHRAQFCTPTKRGTYAEAKSAGWKLRQGRDLCPWCAGSVHPPEGEVST